MIDARLLQLFHPKTQILLAFFSFLLEIFLYIYEYYKEHAQGSPLVVGKVVAPQTAEHLGSEKPTEGCSGELTRCILNTCNRLNVKADGQGNQCMNICSETERPDCRASTQNNGCPSPHTGKKKPFNKCSNSQEYENIQRKTEEWPRLCNRQPSAVHSLQCFGARQMSHGVNMPVKTAPSVCLSNL